MRFVFKFLLLILFVSGLVVIGWVVSNIFAVLESICGISPFFVVFGYVEYVRPSQRDRVHKGNCTCPACRRRTFEKAEIRKIRRSIEALEDVPLFCKVFPEGVVGSCGFCRNGYCAVFEDGCVRWNELGDKMDYSVGRKNPFKGGDVIG